VRRTAHHARVVLFVPPSAPTYTTTIYYARWPRAPADRRLQADNHCLPPSLPDGRFMPRAAHVAHYRLHRHLPTSYCFAFTPFRAARAGPYPSCSLPPLPLAIPPSPAATLRYAASRHTATAPLLRAPCLTRYHTAAARRLDGSPHTYTRGCAHGAHRSLYSACRAMRLARPNVRLRHARTCTAFSLHLTRVGSITHTTLRYTTTPISPQARTCRARD